MAGAFKFIKELTKGVVKGVLGQKGSFTLQDNKDKKPKQDPVEKQTAKIPESVSKSVKLDVLKIKNTYDVKGDFKLSNIDSLSKVGKFNIDRLDFHGVQQLNKNFSFISGELVKTNNNFQKLNNFAQKINTTSGKSFEKLSEKINETITGVDKSIFDVNKKFTDVKSKFDDLDRKIRLIDKKFDVQAKMKNPLLENNSKSKVSPEGVVTSQEPKESSSLLSGLGGLTALGAASFAYGVFSGNQQMVSAPMAAFKGISTAKKTAKITKAVIREAIVKVAQKSGFKAVSKKIPGLGLLSGAGFAVMRAVSGDFTGASLELGSGALGGLLPGFGSAGSIGLDLVLFSRDVYSTIYGKFPEDSSKDEMAEIFNEVVDYFKNPSNDELPIESKAPTKTSSKHNYHTEQGKLVSVDGRKPTQQDIKDYEKLKQEMDDDLSPTKGRENYLKRAGTPREKTDTKSKSKGMASWFSNWFSKDNEQETGSGVMGLFPRTDKTQSFAANFDRQMVERDKAQFLKFGKLPGGFEFLPQHMGRLGSPEAVAATGAMPLGGYGGVGGISGAPMGGYGGGFSGGGRSSDGGSSFFGGGNSSGFGGGTFGLKPTPEKTIDASSLGKLYGKGSGMDRSQFAEELKDPRVLAAFAGRMSKEVGWKKGEEAEKARLAFAEEVFNRAASRGMTLLEAVQGKDGYYPDANPTSSDDPVYVASIMKAFKEGTDITKGATGNASGTVGFGKKGYETFRAEVVKGNPERFGWEEVDIQKGWKQKYEKLKGAPILDQNTNMSTLDAAKAHLEKQLESAPPEDHAQIKQQLEQVNKFKEQLQADIAKDTQPQQVPQQSAEGLSAPKPMIQSAEQDKISQAGQVKGDAYYQRMNINLMGQNFDAGSGGKRESNPALPEGLYPLGPIRTTRLGTVVPFGASGAEKYNEEDFAKHQVWDPVANRYRSQMELHQAFNDKLSTSGCVSINPSQYNKEFIPRLAELQKQYGQLYFFKSGGQVQIITQDRYQEALKQLKTGQPLPNDIAQAATAIASGSGNYAGTPLDKVQEVNKSVLNRITQNTGGATLLDKIRTLRIKGADLSGLKNVQDLVKVGGQAFGGGATHEGSLALASMVQDKFGKDLQKFSGFNDDYHEGSRSHHAKGRAFDASFGSGAKGAQEAIQFIKEKAKEAGVDPKELELLDEYTNPSSGATGGHLHAAFRNKEAAEKFLDWYKKTQLGGEAGVEQVTKETGQPNLEQPKIGIPTQADLMKKSLESSGIGVRGGGVGIASSMMQSTDEQVQKVQDSNVKQYQDKLRELQALRDAGATNVDENTEIRRETRNEANNGSISGGQKYISAEQGVNGSISRVEAKAPEPPPPPKDRGKETVTEEGGMTTAEVGGPDGKEKGDASPADKSAGGGGGPFNAGGRHDPESQPAEAGCGGYGSYGRCFV